MSNPQNYISVALVCVLEIRIAGSGLASIPKDSVNLAAFFNQYFETEITPEVLKISVHELCDWGLLEVIEDPYAGELIIYAAEKITSPYTHLSETGISGLYYAAKSGGPGWFKRVFSNSIFWENLEGESSGDISSLDQSLEIKGQIPASDRIITSKDNQFEYGQVIAELQTIDTELHENNVLGSDLADVKEIIDLEIDVANEVVAKGKFSARALIGWLTPALKFLIEKFAGTAVSEAAKRLFVLLLELLK